MREHPTGPAASTDLPRYLSIKSCANALQLTYKTMWSIIASGSGPPHIRINDRIRVSEDGFRKWLDVKKRG
jgi:hypothetical protein